MSVPVPPSPRLRPRAASVDTRPTRAGQSLVEFALILPVMLLAMLIAVDFGRLFFSYIAVHNAAREAANYAAAHAVDYQAGTLTYGQFHDAAVAAALAEPNVQSQPGAGSLAVASPACFTPGSPPTSIGCANAPEVPAIASGIGNQVSVTVSQPFTFLMPLIGDFFGGSLHLSATATAVVLNPLVAQVSNPTPSPTPTASPTATPTAEPTPTPTGAMCSVPNFFHGYWADTGGLPAVNVWANAGFTGALVDNTGGHKIQSQTIRAGNQVACTSTMTVNQ